MGLFALSAICWIILIHKIRTLRKLRTGSSAFQESFEKNKEHLLRLEKEHLPAPNHPFGEIFFTLKQKTLEVLNKNHFFASQSGSEAAVYLSSADLELIESCALTTLSGQAKKLEHNLFILSTVVTLAPFLGLLGTVWGILVTFAQLHSGGSASSNSVVLGGLSTALATTVLGLVIAIPALIAHNYLKSAHKKMASDAEDCLYELLATLELQYRRS